MSQSRVSVRVRPYLHAHTRTCICARGRIHIGVLARKLTCLSINACGNSIDKPNGHAPGPAGSGARSRCL
eukprot:1232786-Rhodomonas_salina.7